MTDNSKNQNHKYCFILGAGASCDFGYPTGLGLIKTISERLRSTSQMLRLHDQLLDLPSLEFVRNNRREGNGEDFKRHCNQLGECIYFSAVTSIDRFLSINKEKASYQDICKYLIIEEILASEKRSKDQTVDKETKLSTHCHRWEQNWLRVLFGYFFVKDTIDNLIRDLQAERISFISFNYDRLLEYFLSQSIIHLYGLDPTQKQLDLKKLEAIFEAVTIKHVYGRFDVNNASLNNIWSDYGNYSEGSSLKFLGNIRNIHPGMHLAESYSKIIQNSQEIYILGFGFDKDNVDILFDGIPEKSLKNKIFATKYGLSVRVMDDVKRRFYGVFDNSIFYEELWEKDTEARIFDFISSRFGK